MPSITEGVTHMNLRPMTDVDRRAAARHFVDVWTGKGYEKGEWV